MERPSVCQDLTFFDKLKPKKANQSSHQASMQSASVLFEISAVKLCRDGNEFVQECINPLEFFFARLPVDVVIPELVRAEFQTSAHDRPFVQTRYSRRDNKKACKTRIIRKFSSQLTGFLSSVLSV